MLADHSVGSTTAHCNARGCARRSVGITARSLAEPVGRWGADGARPRSARWPNEVWGKLAERRKAGDTFLEMTNRGRGAHLNAPVAMYDPWRLDEQQV